MIKVINLLINIIELVDSFNSYKYRTINRNNLLLCSLNNMRITLIVHIS